MIKEKEIIKNVLDNLKLHNAGIKPRKRSRVDAVSSISEIRYPSLYLSAKQAPELIGYDVDDEVVMVIKGKIMSHSKDESVKNETRENFDIQVKEIGIKAKDVKK